MREEQPHEKGAMPVISVVIPSRQRPTLLVAAIQSVLLQKRDDLELIVVLDGDTTGSAEAVRQAFPNEGCLRILENATPTGLSAARNQGVDAARGAWIAFLDDDDTWLPGKLDKQMALALRSCYPEPVVTGQLDVKSGGEFMICPSGPPTQPISEYLFVQRSFFGGPGLVATQAMLAPRSLLLRVRFDESLVKHQGSDWALRAGQEPTVGFEFVAEPVAIYNCEPGRTRMTESEGWRYSLAWARSRAALMTSKAYAGFLLSHVNSSAIRERDWRAAFPIFIEAIRRGPPSAIDFLRALYAWGPKLRIGSFVRKWFYGRSERSRPGKAPSGLR
jgi:glycosyltransferase involved in cell wall biosynthesis